MIDAILWHPRTSAPWRDLPERYGPWKTTHERLREWTAEGTWEKLLEHVVVTGDAVGVNHGIVSDPSAPFGGLKQSGIGREGARAERNACTQTQHLAVDRGWLH